MGGRQRCQHRVGRALASIAGRSRCGQVGRLTVRRDPRGCNAYIQGVVKARGPSGPRLRRVRLVPILWAAPTLCGLTVTEAVTRRLCEFVWLRCKPAKAARHGR